MASTYTTSLRFNKQGQGDNRNSWGTVFNSGGGSDLLDEAIAGYVAIAMADANQTLTANNGASDQARNPIIRCTGANTAVRTLTIPTVEKWYVIHNATTGGFAITVSNGVNTLSVPNGSSMFIYTDGTTIWNVNSIGSTIAPTSTDAGASAGPVIDLHRDSASPAASDDLGQIQFNGEDSGSNKTQYASIVGQIVDPTNASEDGQLGVTVMFAGSDTQVASFRGDFTGFGPTTAESYFLGRRDGDGYLSLQGGISSTDGAIRTYGASHATNASDIQFFANNSQVYLYDHSATRHIFTNSAYFNTIVRYGQNTTDIPGYPGDNTLGASIYTSGVATIIAGSSSSASTYSGSFNVTNGTGGIVTFQAAGVQKGTISTNGATVSYNTTSDERLKKNFNGFDGGAIIDSINTYRFQWIENDQWAYGVKAQETNQVFPDAIFHDDKTDVWGADYSKFIPLLLAEVKALRARVAELEAR